MRNYEVEINIYFPIFEEYDGYKPIKKWAATFTEAYKIAEPYILKLNCDCYITPKDAHWVYENLKYDETFLAFKARSDYNEIISAFEKRKGKGRAILRKI